MGIHYFSSVPRSAQNGSPDLSKDTAKPSSLPLFYVISAPILVQCVSSAFRGAPDSRRLILFVCSSQTNQSIPISQVTRVTAHLYTSANNSCLIPQYRPNFAPFAHAFPAHGNFPWQFSKPKMRKCSTDHYIRKQSA